jgi:hypothetical protein
MSDDRHQEFDLDLRLLPPGMKNRVRRRGAEISGTPVFEIKALHRAAIPDIAAPICLVEKSRERGSRAKVVRFVVIPENLDLQRVIAKVFREWPQGRQQQEEEKEYSVTHRSHFVPPQIRQLA